MHCIHNLNSVTRLGMRDQIYCSGSLLNAVQTANLFHDCKHFVDMPLKLDAGISQLWEIQNIISERTLSDWKGLLAERGADPMPVEELLKFINDHFDQPGNELEDHLPLDFVEEYAFDRIIDPVYRAWAKELHRKWPTLCRRVSEKVRNEPNRYSLIPLPKPFVVPGGRFREMYYWDSFFTIKGLLASGMFGTVRGMIENMGHLVDSYGFVPNGNRIYYLNRSQPPLMTWCLYAYFTATKDIEFLKLAMPWLEKEMEFFMKNKLIHQPSWKSHLFRYHVVTDGPRPESYREDVESALVVDTLPEKKRLWGDIMAAAESGRDFSSRWFTREGPLAGKMGSTRTSQIIPVDLNSIICGNLKMFAELYTHLDQPDDANRAQLQHDIMKEAIHQVFWSEEDGCWFDYDLNTEQHVKIFFDTNLFPLFSGCVHKDFDGKSVVDYLTGAGVLKYPGGVPTSLTHSGQQWDFPSGWAPTNWVIIQGLRAVGQHEIALLLAEKWIRKNYSIWLGSGGRMFEKYDVASDCFKRMGGGGEYEVQEGFGWTNGVILDLLLTYGDELHFKVDDEIRCECCRPKSAPPECPAESEDKPTGN